MRLSEFEPRFLKKASFDPLYPDDWNRGTSQEVDDIHQADYLVMLCPTCFKKNAGPIGTHSLVLSTPKVPVTIPGDGRWNFVGSSMEDLTFKGVTSDSVLVFKSSNCDGAHFFIRGGEVVLA